HSEADRGPPFRARTARTAKGWERGRCLSPGRRAGLYFLTQPHEKAWFLERDDSRGGISCLAAFWSVPAIAVLLGAWAPRAKAIDAPPSAAPVDSAIAAPPSGLPEAAEEPVPLIRAIRASGFVHVDSMVIIRTF